ncbi:TonB-dependent receptor [Pedobacter sp. PAMC26386]|nr:TonB-dependent receptor [Pedobacter sp. PAMC26386]
MMKKLLSLKLCLLIVCIFSFFVATAQAPQRTEIAVTLVDALKQIRIYYKVNFLYEEINVRNKKVLFTTDNLKGRRIEQVLTILLTPAGLSWSAIDAKNYSIFLTVQKKKTSLPDSQQGSKLSPVLQFFGKVSGRVTDQGQGAAFTTVSLLRAADSLRVKNVLSDTSGAYLFTELKAGDYLILAQGIGYQLSYSEKFCLAAGDSLNVKSLIMIPLPETLQEVKIKLSRPLVEKKGDRYIVNVDKSIIGEGSSVYELMDKLPGVRVNQDGQLTLVGKPGVSVFIDGKAVSLSAADVSSFLKGMFAANVEKIELINIPTAKYDASGSGGVINIIKRKNHKEGLNGNVAIGYGRGRYNRYNSAFNLSFKNSKYNLMFNNSYLSERTFLDSRSVSDLYTGNEFIGNYTSDNFHLRDTKTYSPDLGLEMYLSKKTTLTLSGSGQVRSFRNLSDAHTAVFDQNHQQGFNLDFINKIKEPANNYSSGVHLVNQMDTNGREISADLDYSNYRNSSGQEIAETMNSAQGDFLNLSRIFLDQQSKLNIYSAKLDYVEPLSLNSKLEFGLKSSFVNTKNDSRFYDVSSETAVLDTIKGNRFHYKERVNAAYISLHKKLKKLNYQIGLRVEQTNGTGTQLLTVKQFKQDYFQLFPSVYLEYNINDKNALSMNSGRKIDRPAYGDLNPLLRFINATAYIQGDPNLNPQLSYQNEITYSYNRTLFISLGYGLYTDYITYWVFPEHNIQDKVQETIVSRPVNIDKSSAYSAAVVYIKRLNSWWTMNNNLTFNYNLYSGNINQYKLDNQGTPSFFLSANQAVSISDRVSAEANFRYSGKSQIGSAIYKANSNLSLGIKMILLANKASLSLNVNDIFRDQNFTWTSDAGSIMESRIVRTDSRAVKVNFSYKFGKSAAKKMIISAGAEEEKNRARSN